MNLQPGTRLGPFTLGDTLRQCISEVQFNSRDFKQVKVTFNLKDETKNDIILDLQSCGIYLHFDSRQQRLKMIDVYNFDKITIFYGKSVLTTPDSDLQNGLVSLHKDKHESNDKKRNNFSKIYDIMGLTQLGIYDSKRCLYYVEYPGLWLSFELEKDPGNSELPVDLPDKSSPPLTRMIVLNGENIEHCVLPPLIQYVGYFEPIYVYLNQGILFGWRNRKIYFGSNVQDVLTDVGAPDRIFKKRISQSVSIQSKQNTTNINTANNTNNTNVMFDTSPNIMSSVISNATQSITLHDNQMPVQLPLPLMQLNDSPLTTPVINETINQENENYSNYGNRVKLNDYFFNYINLGCDILFDGNNHCVKKIILHCNQVAHSDFNRWNKSNFYILSPNCSCIHSDSKWKDIIGTFGHPKGDPLMHRSSHSRVTYLNDKNLNKEKSIKIVGYQSVLFEITQNDSIATVTLFEEKLNDSPNNKKSNNNGNKNNIVNRQFGYDLSNNKLYSLKHANSKNPFGGMLMQYSSAIVESQAVTCLNTNLTNATVNINSRKSNKNNDSIVDDNDATNNKNEKIDNVKNGNELNQEIAPMSQNDDSNDNSDKNDNRMDNNVIDTKVNEALSKRSDKRQSKIERRKQRNHGQSESSNDEDNAVEILSNAGNATTRRKKADQHLSDNPNTTIKDNLFDDIAM